MLKYKVGQRVISTHEQRRIGYTLSVDQIGVIREVDTDEPLSDSPYLVDFGGVETWMEEVHLRPDLTDALQSENERLKAIAATVQTWVDDMEDYDTNSYGLTAEEKDVMRAYQRVLALFSEGATK